MKAYILPIIVIILFNGFIGEVFSEEKQKLPDWIKKLIEREESEQTANPPASLSRCKYKNQIVYYLSPRCCDIPSALFDENGNHICSPDGGITGIGDGKCPDFFHERKECAVVWKDTRSKAP